MRVKSEANNLWDSFNSLPKWARYSLFGLALLLIVSYSMDFVLDFGAGFRDGLLNLPSRS
jgi:hypothetical protein